jgi:heptaprenylglyceryl phosphate synthase
MSASISKDYEIKINLLVAFHFDKLDAIHIRAFYSVLNSSNNTFLVRGQHQMLHKSLKYDCGSHGE